jgi:hypothetical protein
MRRFAPSLLLSLLALGHAHGGGISSPDLTWHTVDGGGGTSSGLDFTLSGTIGQCDAGEVMAAGDFTFEGGFWAIIPIAPSCLGDFDGDGQVIAPDLAFILGAWGTPFGDLDGDGTTTAPDIALLLGAWGQCP